MVTFVKVLAGTYRNQTVAGTIFPLVKDIAAGAKGPFITVDASKVMPGCNTSGKIRVSVTSITDYDIVTEDDYLFQNEQLVAFAPVVPVVKTKVAVAVKESLETDEEIKARIAERFDILREMTVATIESDVRAMIVTGPPGVGKSYGIEKELEKAEVFDKLRGPNVQPRFEVMKGAATPIGLYMALYNFKDKGNVIVFDDCDSVLLDDLSLNILKAALDSGRNRRICWNSESNALDREGIPKSFDFRGSVIFVTNLNFDNIRSKKLQDHLAALQSRCHYLDLTLDTERDKFLRIEQIAETGDLFQDYSLTKEQEAEIIEFMRENKEMLRELSLRMALKIADLFAISQTRWQALARSTCMRRVGTKV